MRGALLATPVSFLLTLILRRFVQRIAPGQGRAFVLGGLLIAVWQLAPLFGVYGIGGACDALARRTAAPIVAAVQAYRQEMGGYPQQLQDVTPKYLAAIPQAQCLDGLGTTQQFKLAACSSATLLTTTSFDGVTFVRYNFSTGNWSKVSFLDGECNFLR